ncbi:hypothetical protein INR49_011067, partial [Caranx melampygus]
MLGSSAQGLSSVEEGGQTHTEEAGTPDAGTDREGKSLSEVSGGEPRVTGAVAELRRIIRDWDLTRRYRCADKYRPCENGGTCLDSPTRCIVPIKLLCPVSRMCCLEWVHSSVASGEIIRQIERVSSREDPAGGIWLGWFLCFTVL